MDEIISFSHFVEWGFMAVLAGGVGWSATFLSKISKGICELNTNVAILVERAERHEKDIERHDLRLSRLEGYKKVK